MKILVTGTNSGLGKYVARQFTDVDKLDRSKSPNDFSDIHYDLIIHAAAKVAHYNWDDAIPYEFLGDNIFISMDNKEIDNNNDQKISKEELSAKLMEAMDEFDTNNNKIINDNDY